MNRKQVIAIFSTFVWLTVFSAAFIANAAEQSIPTLTVYKSPTCGCCGKWVEHLRQAGLKVKVEETADPGAIRRSSGIPDHLGSCHTAKAGDYVFEGHIPASSIRRFFAEKPKARGLAVPGMPLGSPGMEADRAEPYDVLLVLPDGSTKVYEKK